MNKVKLGQKVGKEFKFESSRRMSLHLHITVVKLLPKTLIAMRNREFTDFVPKLFKTRINSNFSDPFCVCLGISTEKQHRIRSNSKLDLIKGRFKRCLTIRNPSSLGLHVCHLRVS